MSKANPLPRKYLAIIQNAQEELRCIAHHMKLAIEALDSGKRSLPYLQNILRDAEATAYRIALDLSGIEVADSCDSCPAAPPMTKAVTHLLVLADELEHQATLAREYAVGSTFRHIEDDED